VTVSEKEPTSVTGQEWSAVPESIEFLRRRRKDMFIDGAWTQSASGEVFGSYNPSNGKLLVEIPRGGKEDVNRAVRAARRAFETEWARWKPAERQLLLLRVADLVEKHFDELATLDALEFGGPIKRTLSGRQRSVGMLRFYAGLATAIHGDTIPNSIPGDFLSFTTKEPVGVVGAIIPWNGPIGSTTWKIAPALAAGCTVVVKPSENSSLSALRLVELLVEAGLPAGVVNVVTGYGDAGADLAAHEDVDKIAFTGSTETGRSIIRASAGNIKRLSLELGGKSPNIIFADADLDAAVRGAAFAAFANSGQVCSAGTRLFVERPIVDEVVERLTEESSRLVVGDSLEPATDLGPLASQRQLERVTGYLTLGDEEGARPVVDGRCVSGVPAGGYFVGPTILADVRDSMRIAREEIFGPVVSVLPFTDEDELVARANDTRFGLAAGLWTRDLGRAHRVSRGIRAGTVWINCYQAMDPAIPFGGFKESGYGRESGIHHIEEFLEVKTTIIQI